MRDSSLKIGISEKDFWEMTIGEIVRYSEAKQFTEKQRMLEVATFNYVNANHYAKLIGIVLSGKGQAPEFDEVYRFLYTEEELEEKKRQQNVNNFLAFAHSFNSRFNNKQGGE